MLNALSGARTATRRLTASFVLFAMVLLASGVALAHERFVKHNLLVPLKYEFFGREKWAAYPLGINPDMLMIGVRVAGIMAAFFAIWFARRSLTETVERLVLRKIGGPIQRIMHEVACFLTDRPVRGKIFHSFGEWAVIFFLRSPGLVLMFSATSDALVMPSYPLDPASAQIFKYLQVGLAILILSQTALPLCGAIIFGTWLYLFRWGPMVAVDAMPVLTVAVVYISSPWQSHKLPITKITPTQMRFLRIVLGSGFLALGWLKVWNHNLVAGVVQNEMSMMNDPMISMLIGSHPDPYKLEAFVVAFGLAEVMSGFLVMIGVFTRVWAMMMAFVFTRLLFGVFGFAEIPHVYPVAALLTIIFSNRLTSEVDPIEKLDEDAWRAGKPMRRIAIIGVTAVVSAAVVIFPLLYIFSFYDRSGM